MAKRRWINLGNFADAESFHSTKSSPTTGTSASGFIGGVYEDAHYRYQFSQLVDAGGVTGDVVYNKSYTGIYTVTMTIGNSSAGEVAGVLTATVAVNEFCFVKKGGLHAVKANGIFARGTPMWPDSGNNRAVPAGVFSGSLTAVTDTTVGGVLQVANPLTGAWLVTSLIVNRTTKSTGAATMDAGVGANATTGSDNLLDALDLNATAANGENNFQNAGTNGKASIYGAAGTYLNGTASATAAGLVGTYSGTFEPVGVASVTRLKILGIAQGAISSGKVSTLLDLPYA